MLQIGVIPGYTGEVPDRSTRIADAEDLRSMGAHILVAIAVDQSLDPYPQIMAEVLQARLTDSLSTLLGPYVVWESGKQEPFAPHGLAIWQLPVSQP